MINRRAFVATALGLPFVSLIKVGKAPADNTAAMADSLLAEANKRFYKVFYHPLSRMPGPIHKEAEFEDRIHNYMFEYFWHEYDCLGDLRAAFLATLNKTPRHFTHIHWETVPFVFRIDSKLPFPHSKDKGYYLRCSYWCGIRPEMQKTADRIYKNEFVKKHGYKEYKRLHVCEV